MDAIEARKRTDAIKFKDINYISLVNIFSEINKSINNGYYSVEIKQEIRESDLFELQAEGFTITERSTKSCKYYYIDWASV